MENNLTSNQLNEEDAPENLLENFPDRSNKETWETNHQLITEAIAECMRMHQRMPGKTELAEKTGLSRKTIHQHLKDYALHPAVQEQKEQFGIITANVLAGVVKYAMNGDPRAARLYFEIVDKMMGNNG